MSNNNNPTTEIRRRITRDLFRSILWIDEEIFWFTTNNKGEREYNYEQFHQLFQPVTQELQDEGYLVHLHSFEQSTKDADLDDEFSEESPSLASAIALAKKADIVLLDWHLGSANNPENSIKVLEALVTDAATRFVLILSKYSDNFGNELSDHIIKAPGSKISDLTYSETVSSWTTKSGLHVKVLNKRSNGLSRVTGEDISLAVYELVSLHYPDYLHWAAFEIAQKFRSHVPEWLQSLPAGTDSAVLQELLDDKSEIRSYLPENLLDNLVQIASANSLESLHSANTKREHWTNRPSFIQDAIQSKAEKYIHILKSAKNIRKDFQEILDITETTPGGKEWFTSHQSLVEFCENLPSKDAVPLPGAIYTLIDEGVEHQCIYICVSQECDCVRNSPLLFVKADRIDEVKANSTSLRFNGATFRVDSKAENLHPLPVNQDRSIDSYQKTGQLRGAIATRIISRFWSGTTRPAVNHPTFARALRSEEA
jgi:hypothetical protein